MQRLDHVVDVLVGDVEAGLLGPAQHDRHSLVVRQHHVGRRSPLEPDLLTRRGQDPLSSRCSISARINVRTSS